MEALIMRLTYREEPIALRDIIQCSESFFQMVGGSAGICPTSSPRNGLPELNAKSLCR